MAERILVVDDDDNLRVVLNAILTHHGFDVTLAASARDALQQWAEVQPDLAIVDLMMPEMSGYDLIRELRSKAAAATLPILVLTAKADQADKLGTFEAGANDFVTKPYEPLEVVYRVKSLLSLREKGGDKPSVITVGRVTLDSGSYVAKVDGREVSLGRREAAVLEYLMRNRARVHSAEEITSNVLEQGANPRARSVDAAQTHVRNLRQKLEIDPGEPSIIVTVGRKGYQFRG